MDPEPGNGRLDETRLSKVLSPGATISHYRIIEKIGAGGMGVVYKAEDTKLKRHVALKFLPPDLTRDSEAKQRFIHEAQAASALNHNNITTIHEIDEFEGTCFIAMEYIDGKSIRELVKEKALSLGEILEMAIQIGEGLEAAHKKGVIHRDIKSDNIMVTTDGVAKITDFGLAKLKGITSLTKTGTTLGTVAYMSPEQAQGKELDQRSDIFSFGVVLYEMITRQLPFKGEYEQTVVYSILNEAAEPLARYKANVPEGLQRVIDKALKKDRSTRYQSAADIAADLKDLQEEITTSHLRVPQEEKISSRTIAVLPFKNMVPDPENEWFSDGMTEDVIAQLSKIGDLKVISRTSVMLYKDSNKTIREIGRELGVGTILEGSLRRAGDRLRIVSQLIDAATDGHIWAETYDREMKDVFDIQSDIAQRIAIALKAKLSPEERERLEQKPTKDLTAYDYYLKGREYYNRFHKQDNENAIRLFKKALQLDPDYALAHAGLGDAYGQRVHRFGFARTWADSAIEVSQRAISIDPNCAEAHKALGVGYFVKGCAQKALKAYLKAVELNGNYVAAVVNIGATNRATGRCDEALRWMKKAMALEPTNVINLENVADVYATLGDDANALLWYRRALELDPDSTDAHDGLIRVYLAQGKYGEARPHIRKILSIAPNTHRALRCVGYAELMLGNYAKAKQYYERAMRSCSADFTDISLATRRAFAHWKTNEHEQARKMFRQCLGIAEKQLLLGDESFDPPYIIAAINAIQENREEAYHWLQRAIDAGWRDYRWASIDPLFENLHNDEQFKRMMAEVKAVVDEMRVRVEEAE